MRGARRRWAPRWLVLTHRYLGVGVGALMLLWCLSGVVMLFVHWPQVREDQRVAGLAPIGGGACCRFGVSVADGQMVGEARVERAGGRPVLRLDGLVIDLTTGAPVNAFGEADARTIARAFAPGQTIARVASVDRDQWTVTGYFNARRPFWRVRLGDPAGTDLYVSAKTGEVSQRTTQAGRVLNWAGAIPHWLYPSVLRAHVKLWTQVVIWTSVLGTFLTVTGLYLGLTAWRPAGDRRLSPYRGLTTWHHLTGLATGILTLTWVLSGLLSMNPWGLLESGPDAGPARLAGGEAHAFAQVRQALAAAVAARPDARQIRTAPLAGTLYLMADGERLDAQGRPAPLEAAALAQAAQRLGPVAAHALITEEDAYYFSHHAPVALPAWRVVLADGTRYYLDPRSGAVLQALDAPARGYRWLHLGLHRLDVVPGLRQGGGWAAAMVVLLAAVSLGVGLGVWLAWRRAMHDLAGWRRNRPPSR